MKNKPIIIIAAEPNSVFLEIFFKTVKIINAEKLGAKVVSNKQMLNFIKNKKFN